jgi:protein-L-isoaspartate O-methyltransferase
MYHWQNIHFAQNHSKLYNYIVTICNRIPALFILLLKTGSLVAPCIGELEQNLTNVEKTCQAKEHRQAGQQRTA